MGDWPPPERYFCLQFFSKLGFFLFFKCWVERNYSVLSAPLQFFRMGGTTNLLTHFFERERERTNLIRLECLAKIIRRKNGFIQHFLRATLFCILFRKKKKQFLWFRLFSSPSKAAPNSTTSKRSNPTRFYFYFYFIHLFYILFFFKNNRSSLPDFVYLFIYLFFF